MIAGKTKLCYTEASDFAEIQGVGSDPIYKRYGSVYAVVKKHIDPKYHSFLAEPEYSPDDDQVNWYVDNWAAHELPVAMSELHDSEKEAVRAELNRIVSHYNDTASKLSGEEQKIIRSAMKFVNEEFVYRIGDRVVLVVWGMTPDTHRHLSGGTIIHPLNMVKSHRVTYETGAHGHLSNIMDKNDRVKDGQSISPDKLPRVVVNEGYEFAGWLPDPTAAPIKGNMVCEAQYRAIEKEEPPLPPADPNCKVRFESAGGCTFGGPTEIEVPRGSVVPYGMIPPINCLPGMKFDGFTPDINQPINQDTTFTAHCSATGFNVHFNAGEYGTLNGPASIFAAAGSMLAPNAIPTVTPKPGYTFKGWDRNPTGMSINGDTTFNAVYETMVKKASFWGWMKSYGWWRLLAFLLLLGLLLLLLSMLKGCDGTRHDYFGDHNGPSRIDDPEQFADIPGYAGGGYIGDVPSTPISAPDLGEGIDPGVGDGDYHAGILNPGVQPITDPENPDGPDIYPNIINVFFNDDNANLNAFGSDFRQLYPDTQKYLLDYDDLVKRVSIKVPENERAAIAQNIEDKLGSKYSFVVVDEIAIANEPVASAAAGEDHNPSQLGWHLQAVNASAAWQTTRGSENVIIGVVDDGCDVNHPAFQGKIHKPYNVITKSSQLNFGSGHGTHTAALAGGRTANNGKVSGVAPNCKIMPIEVFYPQGGSTLSAEISGIAYAIHNGADVVNISMGPSYEQYKMYPEQRQEAISEQMGHKEQQVWNKIYEMARKNNTILVFSAGNESIVSAINPNNRPDSIITVTAVTPILTRSSFTNFGKGSTVAAPGVNIISAMPQSQFGVMDGTSQAAPIVAGTVALMKSVDKNITASDAIKILQSTGKPLADRKLGPLIQADKAVEKVAK